MDSPQWWKASSGPPLRVAQHLRPTVLLMSYGTGVIHAVPPPASRPRLPAAGYGRRSRGHRAIGSRRCPRCGRGRGSPTSSFSGSVRPSASVAAQVVGGLGEGWGWAGAGGRGSRILNLKCGSYNLRGCSLRSWGSTNYHLQCTIYNLRGCSLLLVGKYHIPFTMYHLQFERMLAALVVVVGALFLHTDVAELTREFSSGIEIIMITINSISFS